MVSLYKRATPAQAMVLRMVEGAVKNATDAHPGLEISPRHRRSIAKRAAGTLTAQWPDVLAARPSESAADETRRSALRRSSHDQKAAGRGAGQVRTRSPLRLLEQEIARQMREIKDSGNTERVAAMIDVLRMIARLRTP